MSNRLRPSRLLAEVTVAGAKEAFGTIDHSLLFETEVLWDFRRKHELPVEMYSSESWGKKMPERGRYSRAPVSPLCDPPTVAESLHQLTPCGGYAGELPPYSWLVRKSKSRKRPNDLNELRNRSRPTVSQKDW